MSLHPRYAYIASIFALFVAVLLVISLTQVGSSDASTLTDTQNSQTASAALPLDSPMIINELMPLAKSGESQWVELFNNSASLFLPLVSTSGGQEGREATGYSRTAAGATVGNLSG